MKSRDMAVMANLMKDSLIVLIVLIVGLIAARNLMLMAFPSRQALAPLPIDSAFVDGDEKAVTDAITSNPQFKKAVTESIKSRKQAAENNAKSRPTPEQAARVKFLEVLGSKE